MIADDINAEREVLADLLKRLSAVDAEIKERERNRFANAQTIDQMNFQTGKVEQVRVIERDGWALPQNQLRSRFHGIEAEIIRSRERLKKLRVQNIDAMPAVRRQLCRGVTRQGQQIRNQRTIRGLAVATMGPHVTVKLMEPFDLRSEGLSIIDEVFVPLLALRFVEDEE
jgi:uncharacterized protein YjhX (UPF0386 family)